MILLVLILYVHLVSTSSSVPDYARGQNITIDLRNDASTKQRGAGADEALQLFTNLSNLSSAGSAVASEKTVLSNPSASFKQAITEENNKAAQVLELLWRDNPRSNLVPDVFGPSEALAFLKRSKRQASGVGDPSESEASLGQIPGFPGMPYGVLRAPAKVKHSDVYVLRKQMSGMMLQTLFRAQERLWPLEYVIQKYANVAPYRMAFVFMKLDQLVHEGHSILKYIQRKNATLSMIQRLKMYSHLMRRNIDVTYLVDYISARVPVDQATRVRQFLIRKEQEEILKKKIELDRRRR